MNASIGAIAEGPLAVQLGSDPKTLEDMYSMFPVGDGDYRLRVERKQPAFHHAPTGTVKIAGFLADIDEPLSLTDFALRFGGGKYDVSVIGPPSGNQRVDAAGNKIVRLLKKVELQVPGAPKLTYLPVEVKEEQMAVQQLQVTPNVEVEKMRLQMEADRAKKDHDERRFLEERATRAAEEASRTPEKFLVAVREQNERSIEEVKRLAQQQHDLLKAQNDQLRSDYFKTREDADKLRNSLLQVQQDADRRARESETEKIAALKQEHERELRRVHEERASQVDKVAQQHRDDLTRITNAHTEELRRVESAASKERESLTRDAERREAQLQKDAERERQTMRETYESRIAQMKETYDSRFRDLTETTKRETTSLRESRDREIESMKNAHDRELQAVRGQFEMQASVARDTATLRIENSNSEMKRLRDEVARHLARAESLERELQDLRASTHKNPLDAINEAKSMVEIIGWGPKEEKEGGGGEEEFDWKKTLAKAGMGLVEKLPEISRDIMASRAQSAQQAAEQPPQLPPGPQPRMLPPPRQVPSFVQPFPSQSQAAPPQFRQPPQQRMMPQPQPQQPPPMMRPQQPVGFAPPWAQPMQQRPMPMPTQQPMQAPLAQQAPVPMQATEQQFVVPPAESAPQPQEQPQINVKPEQIAEFLQELEGAIRGGIIPPGLFAQGFIDRIGADNARGLMQVFTADSLIATVQEQDASGGTAIVTRDGQRYVRELFQSVTEKLG